MTKRRRKRKKRKAASKAETRPAEAAVAEAEADPVAASERALIEAEARAEEAVARLAASERVLKDAQARADAAEQAAEAEPEAEPEPEPEPEADRDFDDIDDVEDRPFVRAKPKLSRGERRYAKRLASEPPPWPRWSAWKGALLGLMVVVPLLSIAIWLLAATGRGNPEASLVSILQFTTIFAGVPAAVTGAGVARLCARKSTDTFEKSSRRAVKSGALVNGIAGVGLIVIAALPHGHIPTSIGGLIAVGLGGAIAAAIGGGLIGAWAAAGTANETEAF